jgi:multidrug resistance efflux pump
MSDAEGSNGRQSLNPSASPRFSRRETLSSIAAYLGAAGTSNLHPPVENRLVHQPGPKNSDALPVTSPKDGVIVNSVPSESQVQEGQVICHIEPDDENRAMERIRLSEKLIALEGELLSDEQIGARRRLVEIATEITNKYVEYAQFKFDNDKTQEALGVVPEIIVKQSETALAKAKGEKEKSELALRTFDYNIKTMRARHELIKSQIPEEIAFLSHKITRLEVRAPRSGTIRFHFAAGSFVKMGHSLGEIG